MPDGYVTGSSGMSYCNQTPFPPREGWGLGTRLLSAHARTFNFCEVFKHAFKIYGIWPQAYKYVTNTLPQCNPAIVGLAQARPNILVGGDQMLCCAQPSSSYMLFLATS